MIQITYKAYNSHVFSYCFLTKVEFRIAQGKCNKRENVIKAKGFLTRICGRKQQKPSQKLFVMQELKRMSTLLVANKAPNDYKVIHLIK